MNPRIRPCLAFLIIFTALTVPPPASPASPPAAFAGRAFFTAAERRVLEETLEDKMHPLQAPAVSPPASAPPRCFNGALWRKARIVALWLDGHAVSPESETAIRLDPPARIAAGRRQALRPAPSCPPRGSDAP
ncbi:MAG: hypothetical protein LBP86_02815 [Azoarcus sp.]|jgi:hypothetical protein|nr:hypothetical protein [Azoarcus sp.]